MSLSSSSSDGEVFDMSAGVVQRRSKAKADAGQHQDRSAELPSPSTQSPQLEGFKTTNNPAFEEVESPPTSSKAPAATAELSSRVADHGALHSNASFKHLLASDGERGEHALPSVSGRKQAKPPSPTRSADGECLNPLQKRPLENGASISTPKKADVRTSQAADSSDALRNAYAQHNNTVNKQR